MHRVPSARRDYTAWRKIVGLKFSYKVKRIGTTANN